MDQKATCPAAGNLDEQLGEFWLENPWQPTEHNMSAYERNRVVLNTGDGKFADISHASGGADLDSDSRAAVVADFDSDGMPDLLVRNSGGGPLRLFLNRFPKQNSIRVTLRGTRSNSKGIGARLIATIGGQAIHREMQTGNCFLGQSPAEVRFGMQLHAQVDELTVSWPSGERQTFNGLSANCDYIVHEETGISERPWVHEGRENE